MRSYKVTTCGFCALMFMVALPSHSQSMMDRLKAAAKAKASAAANSTATPSTPAAPATPATPATTSGTSADGGATASTAAGATPAATSSPITIAAYQNYDFTPGDTILFADDFTTTQDGEFPEQWSLDQGQAVVNEQAGYPAFLLTDGNYARISPRVKQKAYLGPQFTVEYDTYTESGAYPLLVFFKNGNDTSGTLNLSGGGTDYTADGVRLGGALPTAIGGNAYENKWHHVALVIKNSQLKAYVDQYRVLVVPDMKIKPDSLQLGGIGSQDKPIVFRNFRVASGGGMNMLGQKFTDAKIVTHGINFDVDKATLRPESMGTLNQIKRVMADNPDLKFEIDGHTDNSGASAHNATLSQQRADAVKAQLIAMGIDASRLTTKGYGDSKPMASNDTPDGKANNRRVEFVKVS